VAVLIPLGAAVYGLALWLLRIEGRQELEAVLRRTPGLGRLFRGAL
jgi:hypothetical protein